MLKITLKKNSFFIITLLFLWGSCIREPEIFPNTYQGNFEALWKIIDTRYCFLDYKHINWDYIHQVYKTKVDTVRSNLAFFDLMGKMLAELQDGHVNLYSSFDQTRYWDWFTNYPKNFDINLITNDNYLGKNYRMIGGMKYGRIAKGTIGYVYYGDFSNAFSDENIYYIFKYFENCKGIIIDVRDNGGGLLDYSEQFASYFFKENTITGYMKHKTGSGHSEFSKAEKIITPAHKNIRWERPIVVLTNRLSYSATNQFVCRMKYAPNCVIMGDQTGGGGGLPLSSELPNGWLVRFSACPMFDREMNQIEDGINPIIKVNMKSEDTSNNTDTIIESAIQYIKVL